VTTQLWRVHTYTDDDESVSERIVAAATEKEARELAVLNVKAQNMGKGNKSTEESRAGTHVLSAKKCGNKGVMVINGFPVAIMQNWRKL
jgi:hypothetical protein